MRLAHRQRGQVHEWLREFDQARADYEKAVELMPENAEYHRLLAGICRECPDESKRDLRCALEHAEAAVRLEPQDGREPSRSGRCLSCRGGRDQRRGTNSCEPPTFAVQDRRCSLCTARASDGRRRPPGCAESGRRNRSTRGRIHTVYSRLAEYHSTCGEREQAIAAVTDGIHRCYASDGRVPAYWKGVLIEMYGVRAAALAELKQYQQALEDYRKCVELDPFNWARLRRRRASSSFVCRITTRPWLTSTRQWNWTRGMHSVSGGFLCDSRPSARSSAFAKVCWRWRTRASS